MKMNSMEILALFAIVIWIITFIYAIYEWRWEQQCRKEDEIRRKLNTEISNTEMMGERDMEAYQLWNKYEKRKQDNE